MSAPYKSARDYAESQALPAVPPPLVRTYVVGLVAPRCGINAAQLAEVEQRLRFIAKTLPDDGRITLAAAAYDTATHRVQAEVLNLTRIGKVWISEFYVDPKAGRSSATVHSKLETVYCCDEVWCCPEDSHTGESKARAHAVYKMAQATPRAARYKIIPPWVEVVKPEQPIKVKPKERRLW